MTFNISINFENKVYTTTLTYIYQLNKHKTYTNVSNSLRECLNWLNYLEIVKYKELSIFLSGRSKSFLTIVQENTALLYDFFDKRRVKSVNFINLNSEVLI